MAKKGTILIVEDDERYCRRYQKMLSGQAYHIKITMDIPAAEAELNRLHPDVVLLDLRFPPLDNPEEGLSFLEIVKNLDPFIKVIVVTGVSDREIALKAIERGAYDFVQKDTKQRTELAFRVNQAFEKAQLERELVAFKQKQVSQIGGYFYGPGQMILGTYEKMGTLYRKIDQIAKTDATVLITGKTGTGKELIARAIHYNSPRRAKPFIPINCTAIPREQIEAELFGIGQRVATEVDARRGKFQEAAGGTLFLDEIGDVSLDIQPKLLRAIEQKEIQGVGLPLETVDVRIITATSKDLEGAIEAREFRKDLWYRISLAQLDIPPLRERESDLPLLSEHFLRVKANRHGKSIIGFAEGTIELLLTHSWPGNVRELEHVIESAVIFDEDGWISTDDIDMKIKSPLNPPGPLPDLLESYEKSLILDALRESNWVQKKAADILGIPPDTLRSKMNRLRISKASSKFGFVTN